MPTDIPSTKSPVQTEACVVFASTAQQLLHAFMESLPWGAIALNPQGMVLFASARVRQFLGYDPENTEQNGKKSLLGKALKDLLLSGHVEAAELDRIILQSHEAFFLPEVFFAHSASHEAASAAHILPQWHNGEKTGIIILCMAAADSENAKDTPDAADTAQSLQGARVLLVEDDDINQQIGMELLESRGIVTSLAANGQEAVKAVLEGHFDLVLMDIQMPVMGGMEATRLIRQHNTALPIIAMTGNSSEADQQESLAAGMNGHLTKPIDPEKLYTTLIRWIQTPKADNSHATRQHAANTVPAGKPPGLELHLLEGINVKSGLANVVGNEKLYCDLLRRFADKYRHSGEALSHLAGQHNIEEASRLAHTVKGLAANLGALDLADIVKRIESGIGNQAILAPLIVEYEAQLAMVTRSIDQLTAVVQPKNNEPLVALDANNKAALKKLLEALPALMETDWGTAESELNRFAAVVLRSSLAQRFEQVQKALEDFDLDAVKQESEAILREL